MKIVIDARLINESGVGRYIKNLLENLALIDRENEYVILLKKRDFNSFKFGENFENVEADFNWYSLSEQLKLPGLLNKLSPDLVHLPHFNVPIFYKGKFVVTIHDLIHQHFVMKRATTLDPLTYKIKQFGYNRVFKSAVKNSENILVPSVFVENQLQKEWGVSGKKICVTPEGVDDSLVKIKAKQSSKFQLELLRKLGVGGNYIFYVGNAHPHKNVEGLIKAFFKVKSEEKRNNQDLKLVLSGADHYFWKRTRSEYNDPEIIYTGFVEDEVLTALYSNARLFVMPSFEEGFGIPILESFALGCPVVCSGIGALKEVGADACIYFNPKDTNDIAENISLVLKDEKLRKELIEKGEKRVKDFSWKKLAEETLKIYLTT